jgi:DNA-nicking Smr family endonuclease
MKRRVKSDEMALWGHVTATVHPLGARQLPGVAFPAPAIEPPATPPKPDAPSGAPKTLEPRRARRLARERDAVGGKLDLHGFDQDQARAALMRFLAGAQAEGSRAVMVITGRGVQGDGILRKRAPEWLAEPALRDVVAGVAEAHKRHGGDGALYVALKRRKPR